MFRFTPVFMSAPMWTSSIEHRQGSIHTTVSGYQSVCYVFKVHTYMEKENRLHDKKKRTQCAAYGLFKQAVSILIELELHPLSTIFVFITHAEACLQSF